MDEKELEEEDWEGKCLKCRYSYYKKSDADTLCCRCRSGKCNFKLKKITRYIKEIEK